MAERRDKEQRKREIASAALKLAGTQGLHKLKTAQLAKEVGLSDGAIFRHFANKDEIINAAIKMFEELLMEGFPPKDPHPLKRLHKLFSQRLAVIRKYPELRAIAFNNQLSQVAGEEGANRVESLIKKTLLFIRQCLQEAQEQRMIGADIPTEVLLWSVVGVIRSTALSIPEESFDKKIQTFDLEREETIWEGLEQLLRRSK